MMTKWQNIDMVDVFLTNKATRICNKQFYLNAVAEMVYIMWYDMIWYDIWNDINQQVAKTNKIMTSCRALSWIL